MTFVALFLVALTRTGSNDAIFVPIDTVAIRQMVEDSIVVSFFFDSVWCRNL